MPCRAASVTPVVMKSSSLFAAASASCTALSRTMRRLNASMFALLATIFAASAAALFAGSVGGPPPALLESSAIGAPVAYLVRRRCCSRPGNARQRESIVPKCTAVDRRARKVFLHMRFSLGPLLREIGELDDSGLRVDSAQRVDTAKLVFADHDVLQHDFPALSDDALIETRRAIRGLPPAARAVALARLREEWLLARAAIISVTQARQSTVNTSIAVRGDVQEVWRPSRYGRALVVKAETTHPVDRPAADLIDVKGAGVAKGCDPSRQFHSSGLCSLGEVLRECLFQSLIDDIFRVAA